MSMDLLVERFAFRQHGVDNGGEFLRDQRARKWFAFATLPAVELRFHFWDVLNRANRRVMERDLEIPIPNAYAASTRTKLGVAIDLMIVAISRLPQQEGSAHSGSKGEAERAGRPGGSVTRLVDPFCFWYHI